MNLGTVALLLAGMYLLSGNNKKQSPDMSDLGSLLNDDARSVMDSVGKLSNPSATKEERTGALLQMVTNPAVMGLAEKFFGGSKSSQEKQQEKNDEDINSEGYNLGQYSQESREFFRPVENVAGKEVAHKLYSLYDNRYPRRNNKK